MNLTENNFTDHRWQSLKMRVWEEQIEQAFIFFRDSEIEPILIKGWSVGRFYPHIWERTFSDIDLVVKPEQFLAAEQIVYKHQLNVDLHQSLHQLDTLSVNELFERSETVKCINLNIRVLCAEDLLRVVSVHWLVDGGEYRWKLQDIKYLVENRPSNFDWKKCLESVSDKRQKWILVTIALAQKYYNLTVADLPFLDKISEPNFIPNWLIQSIEKNWQKDIKLQPLRYVLSNPKLLWHQIKKRIPPNPLQATIELEGKIDNTPRIFYQIGNIFWRIPPMLVRFIGKLTGNQAMQNYKW